ncbi:M15 family metallopeptidase [Methylobacterium oryzae]|uniref:M15 family metallopeptidase n=1 Tax=Methylobacterium oryzae TaxID=334852 RepID=UPI000C29C540|nr:M15 family metallopeptidase [Methylobacterium oryzae]
MTLAASRQSIPDDIWAKMQGRSWHSDRGCLPRKNLVFVTLPYLNFSGATVEGHLIVHLDVADDVMIIFTEIHQSGKFRIEKMSLVDDYDGDDDKSMFDNNTSAYNCRLTRGGATMSSHGRGIAIDINPVQNPWVKGSETAPANGVNYNTPDKRDAAFRRGAHGIVMPDDVVVASFARKGWKWGGVFTTRKDYQHFSEDGM